MILTVAALKGGVGKTTAAAHIGHVLAESGRDVLLLDADPQASLTTWSQWGDWPVPVEPFARDRAPQVHAAGWDVVTDCPPFDEGATATAVGQATVVLVPMAPSPIEYERTDALRLLLDRYASHARRVILLSRTVAGAVSTEDYRRRLTDDGWHVLAGEVRRRERFAQSFGQPITYATATAFGDAVAEITRLETIPA